MENQTTKYINRIGINVLFNVLKTATRIMFPLITFPYISRILGVKGLGMIQFSNSIVSYFALLATLGINIYAVREGAKYKNDREKLSKFTREIVTINTISMLISYGLLMFYLRFFFSESYYLLVIIYSLAIVFQTYSLEWLYQIKEDFIYISVISLLFNIISIILMFLFVKTPQDFMKYALIYIIGAYGSVLINWIIIRKHVDLSVVDKLNYYQHMKPILMIFGVSLASSVYMSIDTVMLGSIVGTVAVGLYTVAVQLNNVIKQLLASISNVLFTRLSFYVGQGRFEEYKKLLYNSMNLLIMILLPCAAGLFVLSSDAITLLSGEAYLSATTAARILTINLIFSVLDGILYYQVLLPFGEERLASKSTWLGAIVNVCLNFAVISKYSYTGASITTLIAELCVFASILFCAKKYIDIFLILKYLAKYLLLCIPVIIWCIISKFLIGNMILRIVISVVGSVGIYSSILFVIKDQLFISFFNKTVNK
jgi:hypothetical protein